ncbi:MAG: outer membrane protein assembly factor BamD [Verrucomicrobia bacterium]|jgi:outer membrane protein assembly factor BamD|nr:outer membrane protein assembly factor BamD [Verrucomicrobiota bacterium]
MIRGFTRWVLLLLVVLGGVWHCPAPLIYTPGEGWVYEPVGAEGAWKRTRAKDQIIVAQDAYDRGDYGLSLRAAKHTVKAWPLSDYAPQAQELVAKSYDAKGNPERAFKEYQKLVEKYPMRADYDQVATQQYEIANQFLAGKWFKLWGVIPYPPSMDRVAGMYEKIVKNGPFGGIGPEAQLKVGAAREKQKNYPEAVRAYETAADRYHDKPQVASEAMYRAGMAYNQQANKADYDQSQAVRAIDTLTDFVTLYPEDKRVDEAESVMDSLRNERAQGSYQVAKFYEKRHRWAGALVYYNEVIVLGPESPFADEARERIESLKNHIRGTTN